MLQPHLQSWVIGNDLKAIQTWNKCVILNIHECEDAHGSAAGGVLPIVDSLLITVIAALHHYSHCHDHHNLYEQEQASINIIIDSYLPLNSFYISSV